MGSDARRPLRIATWLLAAGVALTGSAHAYDIGLDVRPRSLRLGSSRPWVTGTLRFPSAGAASSVQASSIRLNGVPVAPGTSVTISGTRLEAVFPRAAVEATVVAGDRVPITVTGVACSGENGCTVDEFGNVVGGDAFAGVDYIRVMPTRIHRPRDGDVLLAGSTFDIRWDADPDGSAVTLWSSLDDGATWQTDVPALPNTGLYRWTVPGTTATRARLRIVTSYGPDENGNVDEPEFLGSDAFAITAAR